MDIWAEEMVKRDLLCEDGTEFVEADIRYPCFKTESVKGNPPGALKKINKFYEDMAELCFNYAKKTLFRHAVAEYAADENPRKKFTHRRYAYTARYRITYSCGNILCVRMDVSLLRGGRKLRIRRTAQTWDLRSGRLCPSYMFSDLNKNAKKFAGGKSSGFYLEGEYTVLFRNSYGEQKYSEISLPIMHGIKNKRPSCE